MEMTKKNKGELDDSSPEGNLAANGDQRPGPQDTNTATEDQEKIVGETVKEMEVTGNDVVHVGDIVQGAEKIQEVSVKGITAKEKPILGESIEGEEVQAQEGGDGVHEVSIAQDSGKKKSPTKRRRKRGKIVFPESRKRERRQRYLIEKQKEAATGVKKKKVKEKDEKIPAVIEYIPHHTVTVVNRTRIYPNTDASYSQDDKKETVQESHSIDKKNRQPTVTCAARRGRSRYVKVTFPQTLSSNTGENLLQQQGEQCCVKFVTNAANLKMLTNKIKRKKKGDRLYNPKKRR